MIPPGGITPAPAPAAMAPLDQLFRRGQFGIKLGLDNIRALCAALGDPERACPVLHVGGTNGKGSVAVMVATALDAAGHRTARFTSPHLVSLEERFVVGGSPAARAALEAALSRVLSAEAAALGRGALVGPATFFELTTAAAFDLFRSAGSDVAVLEVGMGGRFDATNVVSPAAAAITSIDLEHTRHLGHTIEAIAFEKAGIIKPGAPVVVGERRPEAVAVFERVAAERGARLVRALEDTAWSARIVDGETDLALRTPHHDYGVVRLALRGLHQARNAVVAVRLLEEASSAGIAVDPRAITRGLTEAVWPARLEVRRAGTAAVLLDAAHNPAGARSLADYLGAVQPAGLPLLLGLMRDKDAATIVNTLAPVVTRFVFTTPTNPRAWRAADLLAIARERRLSTRIEAVEDPPQALRAMCADHERFVVAGSIYLLGELIPLIDSLGSEERTHTGRTRAVDGSGSA
jgi:dihydrofolate synthase / folylpolyglutamate synthase